MALRLLSSLTERGDIDAKMLLKEMGDGSLLMAMALGIRRIDRGHRGRSSQMSESLKLSEPACIADPLQKWDSMELALLQTIVNHFRNANKPLDWDKVSQHSRSNASILRAQMEVKGFGI